MGLRSGVSTALDKTVGPSTLKKLKRAEARVRRRVIEFLDVEARQQQRSRKAKATQPVRNGEQVRLERIERLGTRSLDGAVNQEGLSWATNDPFVPHPAESRTRHDVLAEVHRLLAPRTYFEVGVRWGDSLTLSRTCTIGVDPVFKIRTELACDLRTYAETSDAFFERPDAFEHFGDAPIDLAFIDGMHLSDFALRDFVNVEKRCAPGSVVMFDDVLPRNHLEAYRLRRTKSWAGDVFKVFKVLRRYRPDLVLLPLNTGPTGTLLVANLDPSSTVLADALPALQDELTAEDPQTVPEEILSRAVAYDPDVVFACPVWKCLAELRNRGDRTALAQAWAELSELPRVSTSR